MDFKGKIAVITGGASGIGKATAILLGKYGADIVIGDLNFDEATQVTEFINKKYKVRTLALKLDIIKKEQIDEFILTVISKFKKIDILVHSAAIVNLMDFLEIKEIDWDRVLNINLKGTFLVCQRVMKEMINQKYGRIITLGSIAGKAGGLAAGADYSASKGGVIALTKSMARYAAQYNITVNCVVPATTDTNMTKDWDEKKKEVVIEASPLKRLGKPEEIAFGILYLASEEAAFTTGSTLDINGGALMD